MEGTTTPSSWRDVYSLMSDTRDDLKGEITTLRSAVDALAQNGEHRLTALETTMATQVVQVAQFGVRLDSVERRQAKDEASTATLTAAHARTVTRRQWLIATGVGVPFAILSVVQLVQALH